MFPIVLLRAASKKRASLSFVPTDKTGLKLWLDADAITGLSDTDPISTWSDQSGNSFDATAAGSNRPTYRTGVLNSKPVVRFDGSDDNMVGGNLGISGSAARSIWIVAIPADEGGASDFNTVFDLTDSTSGAEGGDYSICYEANLTLRVNGNTLWTVGMGTAASILEVTWESSFGSNASDVKAYKNGSLLTRSGGTDKAIATTSGNYTVGYSERQEFAGFKSDFNGDIAEILVYDSIPTSQERSDIEQYLSNKWNITVS